MNGLIPKNHTVHLNGGPLSGEIRNVAMRVLPHFLTFIGGAGSRKQIEIKYEYDFFDPNRSIYWFKYHRVG